MGLSVKAVVENIEVDWSMELVKGIWQAIAKAKYGTNKTSELSTKQVNEVYEEVNRHFSQFGLHLPFFSVENTDEYLNSFN